MKAALYVIVIATVVAFLATVAILSFRNPCPRNNMGHCTSMLLMG